MNRDELKGQWKEIQGKVREQWGKLSDDDIQQTKGEYEQLAGAIQKRYGVTKEEADRQIEEFCQNCG